MTLALTGITCTDSSPTAPSLRGGPARLAIAPAFESLPAGAPSFDLSKLRGVLQGINGDSVVAEAFFAGDSAVLVFNVSFTGQEGVFQLTLTAYDTSGTVIFSGVDTVHVTPGPNPPVQPTKPLQYSAPDAGVTAIHVVPPTVQLQVGQSGNLAVTGADAHGNPVSPIHVGWTSRDPAIASVSDRGLVTADSSEGATWIVARTATNVADSALVSVHAPVATVVVAPDTATVVWGDSVRLSAALADAGGHPITNRKPAWTSSTGAATVNDSGWVTGLSVGHATITATAEGKSGSAEVTVVSPVQSVTMAPSPVTFASLGVTQSLSATAVPQDGVPASRVAALPVTWASSDTGVVSVDRHGVATARGNGRAAITATIDGVPATDSVFVKQLAVSLVVTPPNNGVAGIHGQRRFTAIARDAAGTALAASALTWKSTDPSIATVDSTGLATGVSVGLAGIVASSGTLADTAWFSVSQMPHAIVATFTPDTLSPGVHRAITASVLDYSFEPIPGAPVAFTSLAPGVAAVSSAGVVTGVAPGAGAVVVSSGAAPADTLHFTVLTPTGGVGGLVLNLASVEKLPNGTQQFSIVSGGAGPYVWAVNGVTGGNTTFGTVDTTGFYTAPASVPNPATFPLCVRRQAVATDSACAMVTINPVPTAGGDVVVLNDLNTFDNTAAGDPNNIRFYQNLVDFTGAGSRAAGRKVLVFRGHNSACSGECAPGNWNTFESTMAGEGYTVIDGNDQSTPITSIDPDVKLLVLVLPTQSFAWNEINAIKSFSAEGGRVLFVGEWDGYYGSGITVENDFLTSMGAVMRNVSGAVDCGYTVIPASNIHEHQITSGLTDLTVACLSVLQLGPNDFALVTSVEKPGAVLAGVAKVDLTPLAPPTNRAPAAQRALPATPAAPRPADVHSWGRGPRPAVIRR
ncbi:MAG TPA: Ig-like domain-containing protein [Gemmatimonadaceae bacterium]|nr:Ig-like domain-containing protein [Gemmatimonadaceae bacterium]